MPPGSFGTERSARRWRGGQRPAFFSRIALLLSRAAPEPVRGGLAQGKLLAESVQNLRVRRHPAIRGASQACVPKSRRRVLNIFQACKVIPQA